MYKLNNLVGFDEVQIYKNKIYGKSLLLITEQTINLLQKIKTTSQLLDDIVRSEAEDFELILIYKKQIDELVEEYNLNISIINSLNLLIKKI